MNNEQILNKLYLNAEDLMKLIPEIKYATALRYIKDAQKEMQEKNYFIPQSREKVALTKIIRKRFGF